MTLRKISKIASIGMAVIGLVVVPPLRAFQTEDTTKAVTKKAKKSAPDTTSNAASSDTSTTNKPVEKTEATNSPTGTVKKAKSAPANTVSGSENLGRQGPAAKSGLTLKVAFITRAANGMERPSRGNS